MAMMTLETTRLLLRPMQPSDTEAFFAYGSDLDGLVVTWVPKVPI